MNKELLLLVDILANERNLDKSIIFAGLERALSAATKRSFSPQQPDIYVTIEHSTGHYRTIRRWRVVSDVDFYDDDQEFSLSDVRQNVEKYGKDITIGVVIEEEIPSVDLGRVSAQTSRHILSKYIREAERTQIIKEYGLRNNGIIVGKIKRVEENYCILECLNRIEGVIYKSDLLDKEVLQPGAIIRGVFDINNPVFKNGRILISRTSNEFLSRLLEHNTPEIISNKITIMGIARYPGKRAKVAVISHDARVDAKGSCIGFRNQRIDAVVKELFGEKIDIILYDHDLAQYAINSLAPAEIETITVDEQRRVIDVIVSDDKLGSALGYDGINVRLASKLINCTINVMARSAANLQNAVAKSQAISVLCDELHIETDLAASLFDNGITNITELAIASMNELYIITNSDKTIAEELQTRAKNKSLGKTIMYKEKINALVQDLAPIMTLSRDKIFTLIDNHIYTKLDIADLATDELMDIIAIDEMTANELILKSRELCGFFTGNTVATIG